MYRHHTLEEKKETLRLHQRKKWNVAKKVAMVEKTVMATTSILMNTLLIFVGIIKHIVQTQSQERRVFVILEITESPIPVLPPIFYCCSDAFHESF